VSEDAATPAAAGAGEDLGQAYLRRTRHSRDHLVGGRMDWSRQPEWFKTYPGAARVPLPDFAREGALGGDGLFDALARRRSVRAYSREPLALGELSALLWAAAGVTARQQGFAFRTAPSAGGLFPVEHYVVANRVDGLESGLYHYDVLGRALERLVVADLRVPLANTALGQRICADAQAVFVWTAVLERSRWKYGERFARYVLLDAGHIAENVALAAVALGLGTCQIAAFFDEEAAALLGVDPDVEPVVYMSTAGRPAGT
jgi:SagB-type dehydrogenase family enzyme